MPRDEGAPETLTTSMHATTASFWISQARLVEPVVPLLQTRSVP